MIENDSWVQNLILGSRCMSVSLKRIWFLFFTMLRIRHVWLPSLCVAVKHGQRLMSPFDSVLFSGSDSLFVDQCSHNVPEQSSSTKAAHLPRTHDTDPDTHTFCFSLLIHPFFDNAQMWQGAVFSFPHLLHQGQVLNFIIFYWLTSFNGEFQKEKRRKNPPKNNLSIQDAFSCVGGHPGNMNTLIR